jgi:hypothetical protein
MGTGTLEDLDDTHGALIVNSVHDTPSLISLPHLSDLNPEHRTEEKTLAIFRFFDVPAMSLLHLCDIA